MEEENLIWRRLARDYQQTSSNCLGDRIYDRVNEEHLALKVGYALYNEPSEVNENNKTANYTKDQQKHITLICEKIKSLQPSENGMFYFSCIKVVFRLRNKKKDVGVQVLFRIPKFLFGVLMKESYTFLDPKPRVYDSWELYLQKNKLPKCDMCFPKNGIYTETDGIVDLTFAPSTACKTRTAIFNGLDISSTVLLVGATGVSLASLALPIAVPVVWGAAATVVASGSYDAARKVYSLHDIKKHGESLSFKNPDARSAWLNLAGSVVGMASIGTTAVAKGVLATESAISRAGILTLRVLNVSSLAVSGAGVLNGIVDLVIKRRNGTLQTKDVVQFTFTCFFFLNAIVTYNLASQIIDGMGDCDLKTMFNPRANSCFQFAKDVMQFNNPNTQNILQTLITGIKSQFFPETNIGDLEIAVLTVFASLLKLCSGQTNWKSFCKEMSSVLENIWEKYERVILRAIEEIKDTYDIPNWQSIMLRQVTTNLEVPRLMCENIDKVIETCGIERNSTQQLELMTYARAFSMKETKTEFEFINKFKFYCDCIIAQFREEFETYENCLDSKSADEGFSLIQFDRSFGIQGRKRDFLFKKALDKVNNPDFLENIYELFNNYYQQGSPTVYTQYPFLKTAKSHMYTFCGPLHQNKLDVTFYWNKVSHLTGLEVNARNCTFCQTDNFALIQPKDGQTSSDVAQVEAILINTSFVGDCRMGVLLLVYK